MSHNWHFGELLALQEHREGIAAVIWLDDFLNLNGVVREEVVETVVFVATIVGVVHPLDSERKDTAVVVEERLKVTVVTATFKRNLKVVLELSLIWGHLFEVDHSASVHEGVIGEALSSTLGLVFVCIEGSGELVAVDDSEDTAIEADVLADAKVLPSVAVDAVDFGHKVSLQENALRNARVLDSVFHDVDRVILQVVVEGALANAIVFVRAFNNGFLEVTGEVQNLNGY